jgi:Zn-dependent protease with chaperone function
MAAKRTLPKLSPHAFEHPLDRAATAALQKTPGLDWAIRYFFSLVAERRLRLHFLASGVRVNERQFPRVFAAYQEACRVLDMPKRPELFVAQRLELNAAAVGVDDPFIVVTASMLETMSDEEMQCVLGHELGHVLSGHALYTTMLLLLLRMWEMFLGIPGGIFAVIGLRLALLEWRRKAELSADRAGLLVAQDPSLAYTVDMKLAGGRQTDQMSLEEFVRQADEYQAGGDILEGMLKLMASALETHPFPVLRVAELKRWVESGAYDRILAGEYEKRGAEPASSWVDHLRATADAYKESFSGPQDGFVQAVRDLAGGAASAADDALGFIRRTLGLR